MAPRCEDRTSYERPAGSALLKRTGLAATLLALAAGCGRTPTLESTEPRLVGRFPSPIQGVAYRASVAIAPPSMTPPVVEIVDGRLPPGLTLGINPNGEFEVSGTPLDTGRFAAVLAVRVTTPRVEDFRAVVTFDVLIDIPDQPLALSGDNLPPGTLDSPYEAFLEASGGAPPYAFEAQGRFAAGLTLEPSGRLFGTPVEPGRRSTRVQVTDEIGQVISSIISLDVLPANEPELTDAVLPPARVLKPYATTVEGMGGDGGPYDWRLVRGAFPVGVGFRFRRGRVIELAGSPATSGFYQFGLEIRDSRGLTGEAIYSLRVVDPLIASDRVLQTGRVSVNYRASLPLLNPLPPVSAEVTSGSLPAGLRVTQSGDRTFNLEGRPTLAAVFRFSVRFTDRFETVEATYFVRVTR